MTDPPQAARACADVPSLLYTCYITIKSCVSGIAFIFVATTSSTTPPIPGSTPPPLLPAPPSTPAPVDPCFSFSVNPLHSPNATNLYG